MCNRPWLETNICRVRTVDHGNYQGYDTYLFCVWILKWVILLVSFSYVCNGQEIKCDKKYLHVYFQWRLALSSEERTRAFIFFSQCKLQFERRRGEEPPIGTARPYVNCLTQMERERIRTYAARMLETKVWLNVNYIDNILLQTATPLEQLVIIPPFDGNAGK